MKDMSISFSLKYQTEFQNSSGYFALKLSMSNFLSFKEIKIPINFFFKFVGLNNITPSFLLEWLFVIFGLYNSVPILKFNF